MDVAASVFHRGLHLLTTWPKTGHYIHPRISRLALRVVGVTLEPKLAEPKPHVAEAAQGAPHGETVVAL
eukprot:1207492-Amphidinium_carterae.1